MKIFMTGSDGFIGSHLMSTLQEHEIQTLSHDLREHKKVEEQNMSNRKKKTRKIAKNRM